MKFRPVAAQLFYCGRTDRHDKCISRFAQFCESAKKRPSYTCPCHEGNINGSGWSNSSRGRINPVQELRCQLNGRLMTRLGPIVDLENHIWFGLENHRLNHMFGLEIHMFFDIVNHMVEPCGWHWKPYGWIICLTLNPIYVLYLKTMWFSRSTRIWFDHKVNNIVQPYGFQSSHRIWFLRSNIGPSLAIILISLGIKF